MKLSIGKYAIKFNRSFDKYMAGEVAGFDAPSARFLIDSDIGVKTQASENVPVEGPAPSDDSFTQRIAEEVKKNEGKARRGRPPLKK